MARVDYQRASNVSLQCIITQQLTLDRCCNAPSATAGPCHTCSSVFSRNSSRVAPYIAAVPGCWLPFYRALSRRGPTPPGAARRDRGYRRVAESCLTLWLHVMPVRKPLAPLHRSPTYTAVMYSVDWRGASDRHIPLSGSVGGGMHLHSWQDDLSAGLCYVDQKSQMILTVSSTNWP